MEQEPTQENQGEMMEDEAFEAMMAQLAEHEDECKRSELEFIRLVENNATKEELLDLLVEILRISFHINGCKEFDESNIHDVDDFGTMKADETFLEKEVSDPSKIVELLQSGGSDAVCAYLIEKFKGR